jgi:serine/threonine protein phosphatase 1
VTAAYAIGDIHGHLDLLRRAHDLIEDDRARHGLRDTPVVHLGDLVDRGPDSAGVIRTLAEGIAAGHDWHVLRGNHDRMFAAFLDDPLQRDPGLRAEYSWLHPRIGGAATLESYGLHAPGDRPLAPVLDEARAAVPARDRAFLAALPGHLLVGGTLFVHAGIRPGVALADQTATDLCWIREPFLSHSGPHPWLVVHGHTAVTVAEHHGNRVNIDTGAAYGGPLTAVVIEDGAVSVLTLGQRRPLRPAAR